METFEIFDRHTPKADESLKMTDKKMTDDGPYRGCSPSRQTLKEKDPKKAYKQTAQRATTAGIGYYLKKLRTSSAYLAAISSKNDQEVQRLTIETKHTAIRQQYVFIIKRFAFYISNACADSTKGRTGRRRCTRHTVMPFDP